MKTKLLGLLAVGALITLPSCTYNANEVKLVNSTVKYYECMQGETPIVKADVDYQSKKNLCRGAFGKPLW